MDRHACRYERGLWNKAAKRYDLRKCDCCALMMTFKKFRYYEYGVRFLVETDANRLVHQLNLPANDLQGALVTCRIAWIPLFYFYAKYVPGRVNGGTDGLTRQPQGDAEPDPADDVDREESFEASLRGRRVE
jgi:hypothetical protein